MDRAFVLDFDSFDSIYFLTDRVQREDYRVIMQIDGPWIAHNIGSKSLFGIVINVK